MKRKMVRLIAVSASVCLMAMLGSMATGCASKPYTVQSHGDGTVTVTGKNTSDAMQGLKDVLDKEAAAEKGK